MIIITISYIDLLSYKGNLRALYETIPGHVSFFWTVIGYISVAGAVTPGFHSLISTPRVPSLISTEPVELLCRDSNIRTADPFCFVKQKQETVEVFLQFLFTNMRSFALHSQNENSRR